MKVCILGNGLTSLMLATALVNKEIFVDIILTDKIKYFNKGRTLGISKTNIEFINKNIFDIAKFLWNIDKIEVYSQKLKIEKILNFENKNGNLFSIIKNHKLINHLIKKLNKNNFCHFKKKIITEDTMNNYNLVINCDSSNPITKKFFSKKMKKNYESYAYTSIINHQKLANNNVAVQIFTEIGPLAFLPVSETETSVVYSARGNKNLNLSETIKNYNTKYKIKKFTEPYLFELKSSNLRNYYYKNVLAFGDLLHKIHPLAGQGFNMTIRDIKELIKLIKYKLDRGLEIDSSICADFEKNTKHKNYLFTNGIDFIYEFFHLENKIQSNIFSKSVKFVGRNKTLNGIFKRFADSGFIY